MGVTLLNTGAQLILCEATKHMNTTDTVCVRPLNTVVQLILYEVAKYSGTTDTV